MKNIPTICWFFVLIFSTQITFAQFNETIRTGRPGQAIGPFAVGRGVFQIQTGYQFGQTQQHPASQNTHSYSTVFRLGLTEVFEVNTAVDIEQNRFINQERQLTHHYGGVSNWAMGFRYHIFDGKGLIPSVGLQTSIKLNNTLQEEFHTDNITPRLALITKQDFTKNLSLFTNVGVNWNGDTGAAQEFYVLNLSYSLNSKIGFMVENYGNLKDTNWDAGIAYLLNPNIQFDLYGGGKARQWFVSLGCSWRFAKR